MKEILRKIYYSILKLLPDKLVINLENLSAYKKVVNKDNPKYFGEKIQWLKLYGNLEKYEKYVDKYKVRDYVSNKIGKEYLIPLMGVYDKAEEIDYTKLPEKFVLKGNHGSGYNIIVKDKTKLNISKTNKKLNKWIKEDYSKIKKEHQYANVKRKIVCEEYISDRNGQLVDYKFFCFDGKPYFVKVDYDRFNNHRANFYDLEWNLLNMKEDTFDNYDGIATKPENFSKMIQIATKLCEDFQFVRVDLYDVDGRIYFGELTFTPASGKHPFYPLEKDLEIASKIKI